MMNFTTYQVQVCVERAAELHVLHKVGPLSFIWCDHTDLFRFHACTQEPSGNLFYIRCFSPVREKQQVMQRTTAHPEHEIQDKAERMLHDSCCCPYCYCYYFFVLVLSFSFGTNCCSLLRARDRLYLILMNIFDSAICYISLCYSDSLYLNFSYFSSINIVNIFSISHL